jgi:hypothetical protein
MRDLEKIYLQRLDGNSSTSNRGGRNPNQAGSIMQNPGSVNVGYSDDELY